MSHRYELFVNGRRVGDYRSRRMAVEVGNACLRVLDGGEWRIDDACEREERVARAAGKFVWVADDGLRHVQWDGDFAPYKRDYEDAAYALDKADEGAPAADAAWERLAAEVEQYGVDAAFRRARARKAGYVAADGGWS